MVKLFSVVGVSRLRAQDPFKLRVANGGADARAKRLVRCGHVDVNLFDTVSMSKEDALNWLEVNHPKLAAQLANKQVKSVRGKSKVVKVVAKAVEPEVEVKDVPLSPAAKLALKRMKDAARKREKRAAEKAAKLAAVA